ncbi:MAG: sugar phosphate isomerase/epimerase [Chloroflexi bacterium]|nr:sugar phosphate isomerase/epimerase [Chloroflexota bacterium]
MAAALELVPKLGLDHIELAMRGHGGQVIVPTDVVANETMGPEREAHLRQTLQAHGVQAITGNGGDNMRDPVGVARFKARLDMAQRLGMCLIIGSGGEATEEDRPALIATLREVGDYAAARNLTVCLETHPGVTVNAAQMLRTMQELQHPSVKLNFDTANVLYYNEGADVLTELRSVVPYIGHVHLKDSRGQLRDWYFPALGDGGAVDFAAVGRILNDGGFFGPFSIELEGIEGEPELTLEQRQERLQRSVDHLRKVGFL